MTTSLTTCPECGAPAEIKRRFVLESTDGPIEHANVACVRRHWFSLPLVDRAAVVDRLAAQHKAGEHDAVQRTRYGT